MPGLLQPRRETIFLPNGKVMVRVWSLFTGKCNEDVLDITREQWDLWQAGTHIQTAMPHLSPDQREYLLTGATPEEWDAAFPEDD